MLSYSNHLGLYAEEVGSAGEALGNFPQAFTHLGLISAALDLDTESQPAPASVICYPCNMRTWRFVGVIGLALAAWGQSPPAGGVDLQAIDKSVDPCQNFYLYACGKWMKANPIPPEYARWGRFDELAERNEKILREILEDSAKHQDRSPADQKIGAFYSSCMNEAAIDKAGDGPLKPGLERIHALKSKDELPGGSGAAACARRERILCIWLQSGCGQLER